MNSSAHLKSSIDQSRLNDALMAADFLAQNFGKEGKYEVEETWGPEGVLYQAESSWALLEAYKASGEQKYLNTVKTILNRLSKQQNSSGGWAIALGKSGEGFKVNDEERRDTEAYEDPPTTAAILKTIADYQLISDDDSFYKIGEKAFNHLMTLWDSEIGTFIEREDNKLLNLRSNPYSYHLFFLLGMDSWKHFEEERVQAIFPSLLTFVQNTFEAFDRYTMPLVYGLHAATLMRSCSDHYRETVVKPRLDNDLLNNEVFICEGVPGGYGHRDGSRGIVTSEAHMRSSAGIALALKQYDLVSNTSTYQDSNKYQDIAHWIDQMKTEQFFYEFEVLPERVKKGYGSPGQYLPCFWILGSF